MLHLGSHFVVLEKLFLTVLGLLVLNGGNMQFPDADPGPQKLVQLSRYDIDAHLDSKYI